MRPVTGIRLLAWLAAAALMAAPARATESDGSLVRGLAAVDTSRELWSALMDNKVARVQVTADLSLRRDVWPGDDGHRRHAMVVRRDVIIEGAPTIAGRRPRIDLDYMRFRVAPGRGRVLVVRGLEFTSAVKNSRDTELQLTVPFFTQRKNSTLVLDDIVAPVAVGFTAPLATLLVLVRGIRPEGLEGRNALSRVGKEECRAGWGVPCPEQALWVEDFAGIMEVEEVNVIRRVQRKYDVTLVMKDSLMVAVNVDNMEFNSTEDTSGRRTFVADSLFELFEAMMDPEVVTVHLFNDMVFDMSSWPNLHGHLIETCSLDRDVVITTHPTSASKAKFDFNLAKNGISVRGNSTLTLRDVFLTRTSRNPDHTLTLPFFDVERGSTLHLHGVVAHTPIRTTDVQYIASLVNRLEHAGAHVPWHSVEYHDPARCKDFAPRKDSPCDGGFLVTSVLPNSPMVAPHVQPEDLGSDAPGLVFVNSSFFSVLDLKKRRIKSEEEELHQQRGIALVSTEGQLRQALKNETVRAIWLRNNLNLTNRAWPGGRNSSMMVVDRDVMIASHPTTGLSLAIDLDYMIARVAAGENHNLSFDRLNFTRVSREGIHLHYVPFFCWQNNSTLFFRQVLSQMAVEPTRWESWQQVLGK
ncbi:unnamed protein product [Ostreobium quekettii]|uniref:Uncharacterized protein n=1 Tax=Ostreobium quekettii TaxID=121088 RepID=A0A8S1J6F5_9CHLO|nr:unnamed protein product [Ostreobium quekettii]